MIIKRRLFAVALAAALGATVSIGTTPPGEAAPDRPPAEVRAAPGPDPVTVPVAGTLSTINRASGPTLTPAFSAQTHDYALWCTGGSNQVELTFTGSNLAVDGARGSTVRKTFTLVEHQALVVKANGSEYWMRCLPRDFPRMEVTKNGTVPDGWYIMDSQDPFTGEARAKYDLPYAMITDTNGTPVWYIGTSGGYFNTQRLDPAELSWSPQVGPVGLRPDHAFRRYDLTSQMLSSVGPTRIGHLDPHEFIKLRNGNYAWILTPPVNRNLSAYPAAGDTTSFWDCVIQEVRPGGEEVWNWRMSDRVNLAESQNSIATTGTPNSSFPSFERYDPYHCNSIDEDAAGNLVVSARNMNAAFYINRRSGNIDWKLGGVAPTDPGTTKHIRTFRTASGATGKPFVAQHDARFTAGHTPQSPRISLFDNHYQAPELVRTKSRGLEYAIDLTAGATSATELWAWENTRENPSRFQAAFQRNAATGENVFGWGSLPNSGITEVDNDGVIKRRIKLLGLAGYRARKIPADALEPWVLRAAAGRPIVTCSAPVLDKEAEQAGALGDRASNLYTALPRGGCDRLYSRGTHAIVYSPETGTFTNKGAIRERYLAAGGPGGWLGYPTSDEFCGLRDDGCGQRFQNGIAYWTLGTGAQLMSPAFLNRYGDFGWEDSPLGYPTSDQFCGLRDGGCAQRFQGGLIYQSPAGIHPVWGAIAGKYADLRWETGTLRYPTGAEFCGLRDNGCAQRFQGGMIYWSPASGAHLSIGALHEAYAREGYENGRLRYPVTDERCNAGGCVQDFQGGRITWDRTRGATVTYR